MLPNRAAAGTTALPPYNLVGEAATVSFAQDIAMAARPGWTILLEGDLGAGKTSFARGFIRALAADTKLDVPSPTFTLVHRYPETSPEVVHADLYRISDPSELDELGLDDPDDPAIRLIEWPDRAGPEAFGQKGALDDPLTISFAITGEEERRVLVCGDDAKIAALLHTGRARSLLEEAGEGAAARSRFQGDASSRRYELVDTGEGVSFLMDAPQQPDGPPVDVDLGPLGTRSKPYSQHVHLAESVHPFVAVSAALNEQGFSAPVIKAADLDAGLLLMEHLGSEGMLDEDRRPIASRYLAAAELLASLHSKNFPHELPVRWSARGGTGPRDNAATKTADVATRNGHGSAIWPDEAVHRVSRYDLEVYLTEITLCPDWYVPYRKGLDRPVSGFDRDAFLSAWQAMIEARVREPSTLVLRDFHSPNLIWRSAQPGHQRVGIIDHQDALIGSPAYDLASLAQDARATVEPDLQAALLDAYIAARGREKQVHDLQAFLDEFVLISLQRHTKLMGLWARLDKRDGKPHYLQHMPRTLRYIRQLFSGPHAASLVPLAPFYDRLVEGMM